MTDLIICLVIAALMIFAFVKLKKRGGCGCGCGCDSCSAKCDERKDEND